MNLVSSILDNGLLGFLKLIRIRSKFPFCKINSVRVDRKASLASNVAIAHDVEIRGNVSIGSWTYIEPYSFVNGAIIGRFCAIGRNVAIGGFQHPYEYPTISPKIYRDILGSRYDDPPHNIKIGNDVWIGEKAIILGGEIGNGAIVAAGAVVTKDVEPYSIVAGVPAKKIGDRFDSDEKKLLQELKWWDWSDEEIKDHETFFELRDQWRKYVESYLESNG